MASNLNELAPEHQGLSSLGCVNTLSINTLQMKEGSTKEPDVTKRDRFELLSAYLDGEVTPEECRQVTCWLAEDAEAQRLYERLLALREAMQTLPLHLATEKTDCDQLAEAVFKRTAPSWRMITLAVAAATILIGGLTSLFGPTLSLWKLTDLPQPAWPQADPLELALDKPVIEFAPATDLTQSTETTSEAL
jgi:hypothetical protein